MPSLDKVIASYLVFLSLYLLYALIISFNMMAGITALAKDCNTIAVVLLGYHYRRKSHVVLYCILAFIIFNDVAQLFLYPLEIAGIARVRFENIGGISLAKAGGFIDPAAFGFANFIGMLLADRFLPPKQRQFFVPFFFTFGILAFMTKSIFAFMAYFIYYCVKRRSKLLLLLVPFALTVGGGLIMFLHEQVSNRLDAYVWQERTTARAESYRVMMESLEDGNILGEGLGTFGGPSSIEYDSPLYQRYRFDWGGLVCATTDTYFPHLFVEMGLVGGILFLAIFILPLLSPGIPKENMFLFFAILIELFWESATEFYIEDVKMLFVSALVLFPLCHANFRYLPDSLFDDFPDNGHGFHPIYRLTEMPRQYCP